MSVAGHAGDLAVAAAAAYGVEEVFALNGGHVWPVLDACRRRGFPVYDVRHEQTAVFAAEGVARLTRRPGVAVVTAGPGVTNGVSGLATAWFNGSPVLVVGGRAPGARWGMGDLQEIDHVPLVASVTKSAATVGAASATARVVGAALARSVEPHRGPVFVDLPLDVAFSTAEGDVPAPAEGGPVEPDPGEVARAAAVLAGAARPALVAGSDVWWGRAEEALAACAEALRLPVFANGQGRGCLPADHGLAFSRARGLLDEADVVAVVGAPLDFRLRFGAFGAARVVHAPDTPARVASHVRLAAAPAGDPAAVLAGLAAWAGPRADHEPWIVRLRDEERARREAERPLLSAGAEPIRPSRVYGDLLARLDRDAIVIGDGGDFVSYAGRFVDSYQPGCWLDPGPYGCLGVGPGYAMAARLAHPDRQVVLLAGDGAFGFAGFDLDSLVRHRLPVVVVVGNNGIWGLEKHPMAAIYGHSVAADLAPGTRYDLVAAALGGAGETVSRPADIGPALDRAFAAGVPYVVNVLTDPADAYPRRTPLG